VLRGWAQYFVILSRFIDTSGQSANTRGGSCIESVAIRGPAIFNLATKEHRIAQQTLELYFKHGQRQGGGYTAIGLDLTSKSLVVEIPTSSVDLARANEMVAIATLGNSGFQGIWRDQSQQEWVTDLLGSAPGSQTACGKLDDAVRFHLIVKSNNPAASSTARPAKDAGRRQGSANTYWKTDKGSILLLTEDRNGDVTFRFSKLTQDLVTRFGITTGVTAFTGKRKGDYLQGQAIAFMNYGCRVPYDMRITVEQSGDTMLAQGEPAAEVASDCSVLRKGNLSSRWTRVEASDIRE
jgi:hypothetical protein